MVPIKAASGRRVYESLRAHPSRRSPNSINSRSFHIKNSSIFSNPYTHSHRRATRSSGNPASLMASGPLHGPRSSKRLFAAHLPVSCPRVAGTDKRAAIQGSLPTREPRLPQRLLLLPIRLSVPVRIGGAFVWPPELTYRPRRYLQMCIQGLRHGTPGHDPILNRY